MNFDVVVIGSGAGGAPVAHSLVKAGKNVLVIDKGPLIDTANPQRPSGFKRDELLGYGCEKTLNVPGAENNGAAYFASHVEPDLTDEPHVYRNRNGQDFATMEGYTAQVVGGGTQLYGGVSLRFTEDDFRLRSINETRAIKHDSNDDIKRESRDWPISYADLEPYYCKAEKLIGINGTHENQQKRFSEHHYQPPLLANGISEYARLGMLQLAQRLGIDVKPYRPPLAVITRDHPPSGRVVPADPELLKTGYINRYGDPLGAKSNTWVALLRPLKRLPNFTLWPNCTVCSLQSEGAKVNKIRVLTPDGELRDVQCKYVVVACSAIESVRLLKLAAQDDTNFDKRIHASGLLGRYFLTHCFGGASAVMPEQFDKSVSLDADWATDICATRAFMDSNGLWAGAAIYNNTSDQALPLSLFRTHGSQDLDTLWHAFSTDSRLLGQGMIDFLDDQFGRNLSISFMANQVPQFENHIRLHPTVRDKWNQPVAYIIKDWHEHDRYLMDVMAEQCAQVLRYGVDPVNGKFEIEGKGGIYQANNSLARMANHILGGARFGDDPADSVLDPNCRAWEFDNLYITDGAFMPTSGSANPTLTIQANAFRVADKLLARM